ncbi:MAG: alpha/beta hydrolase [Treponema sp.]|nr:alpha/beta hydrolase [Treponema sp.]MBQ2552005.1 alpha/beta hydrolase [Treponema sp.]MBQ4236135.1 alpha/beta hydrolase [Treponema sp.]MBQ5383625.1 alpha/beta hydrolase [Treponema sp.]
MSLKYFFMEAFSKNQKESFLQHLENPELVTDVPEWCYKKYDVKKNEDEENPVFIIKSKTKEAVRAVLYIYGGCGILGPSKRQFKMAAKLADATKSVVYMPFYPLAPKNNVRFALRWLQKVYADMLKDWSAKKIVFIGDSYGANLAMSLCYRVAGRPSKLVMISPAIGLDNETGLENRKSSEASDRIMSVEADKLIALNWFKNVRVDSSDADPIRVDCSNFPPSCLFYGTKELYAKSVGQLISKIEEGYTPLEVIKRKMGHDWAILQDTPEGKKALKQIAAFIEKEFGPVQPKVAVPEKTEEPEDEQEESTETPEENGEPQD